MRSYKTNYTPESGYTASSTPQAIEILSGKPIVQIASGASHTMALTCNHRARP
jgi:alpha-tubulin suppressor-like RCC1 family protein